MPLARLKENLNGGYVVQQYPLLRTMEREMNADVPKGKPKFKFVPSCVISPPKKDAPTCP